MEFDEKLKILGESAKYDVSCSSSGSSRKETAGGTGNASLGGICHTFSSDGRCISLLKILLSNMCAYDCAYCVNRRTNDIPRAAFTPEEAASVTMNFYKRNYIEGLFLSSGVLQSPDYTMELMVKTVRLLRQTHNFGGYIHMKIIPGASQALVDEAGFLCDRVSVNIEMPSSHSLQLLAPDKTRNSILDPMKRLTAKISQNKSEMKTGNKIKPYAPAGQSTQMIIGASPETDLSIITLSESLYNKMNLKRVYYSAYIQVNTDDRLPMLKETPLLRENRLYQADWLMRFYHFRADEILDADNPTFDERFDPKAAWALRNLQHFPLEVNSAQYEMLLRVPGIGVRSAQKIVKARKVKALNDFDLKKAGVVMKRAKYFLTAGGKYCGEIKSMKKEILESQMLALPQRTQSKQMLLFDNQALNIDEMKKTVTGEL